MTRVEGYGGYISHDNCYAITGHPPHLIRVLLDGEDVTASTLGVHLRKGYVRVVPRPKYADSNGKLVLIRRYGKVEMQFVNPS